MEEITVSHMGLIDSDKKLVNDEKWRNFVTSRATMGKKPVNYDKIKKELVIAMNPFSQELYIEASTRLDPDAWVNDENGNQIPASSVIEKQLATKIYHSAANRDRVMNLSATAMRMLWFITYEIEGADDWVCLDPEWYKEASKAGSRNMYKKGKDELVRCGYISRTEYKNIYWVNPSLLYGGNRLTKFKSKVVVKNVYTGKSQPKPTVKKSGMTLVKKKGVYETE